MRIIKREFRSISELVKYISEKPLNSVFKNQSYLASSEVDSYRTTFTQTESFDEALDMLLHGWSGGAQKINARLQAKKVSSTKKSSRISYDVVGHQASVPRYLQGIPTNMVNKRTIVKKQPVITLVKNIGYNAGVSANEIMEQSVRAMQIIQMLENSGVRINLDLIKIASGGKQEMVSRIRIKNASERLNVSKMAFPLMHPSMLRRIMFALTEREEELTDNYFSGSYGRSKNSQEELQEAVNKGEYVIPGFIDEDVTKTIENMGLKLQK